MKKFSKKFISAILAVILLVSAYPFSVATFAAESEEAEFFNLIDSNSSSLDAAISAGKATGNWTQAKSELLNYYKNKFSALTWIKPDAAVNGSKETIVRDMLTIYESYLTEANVSVDSTWVDIPMTSVKNHYVLTTYKHSEDSGIVIASKESGQTPKLVIKCTDGTSYTIPATADAYVRATGKNVTTGNAASYSTTAWGVSNPNELWVMHQSDVQNQMPYSNNEMRTYIFFDTSVLQGKKLASVNLSVYAHVQNVSGSDLSCSDTTLPLVVMESYHKTWEENTLTWKSIADVNGIAHYSWNGLGGIVWNEDLYGKAYANLHVPSEFINANSRFEEISSLCQAGQYAEAKRVLMRFADQTFSAIKSGDGFPYRRDIEPANRALEIPYIYRQLLINDYLTPEENYTFLRWLYQNSLYIVFEKSTQIFTDGDITPNQSTEYVKNNRGAWHICGFFNSFFFFDEFSEAQQWEKLYSRRLELIENSIINEDGSYKEITLGYPVDVISWFTGMLYIMDMADYQSPSTEIFKSKLVALSKYLMDCSYPGGILPRYGDGSGGNVKNAIKEIINSIAEDDSENMQNIIWYLSNGESGREPKKTAIYKNAKLVTDRTGWGSDDKMIFMNAKSGGSHTHKDALSLLMSAYGRELLTDTGTTTYDSHTEEFQFQRMTSRSHNTIEVDSTAQRAPGLPEDAYDINSDNINIYANDSASTIRAYTTSNKNATHYRNVTFLKSYGGLLLVSDLVKPSDSSTHTYTQNWHSAVNSNPTVTTKIGDFSDNVWGYTNFADGANVMIAQATPYDDVSSGVSASLQLGYDETSGTGTTQYFEFKQNGAGNVSYNTAILPYQTNTKGIRTVKLTTNVKDSIASSFRIQFFKDSKLSAVNDEIVYYNSFENTPSERTLQRRTDSDGYRQYFTTNALNSAYHVQNSEKIDMLSLSNGTSLECFMSQQANAVAQDSIMLGRIKTSAKVTDLYAEYDNGTVKIESSDTGIIQRTTSAQISFEQMDEITSVVLNGDELENGVNYKIENGVIILFSDCLFFDFKNDDAAANRYSQSSYGSTQINYDTSGWAVNSSRNGTLSFSSENEGIMSHPVIIGSGYSGFDNSYVQTSANGSLGQGAQSLAFDITTAEIVQIRLKFKNCVPTSDTNATAIFSNEFSGNDYVWKYCQTKNFTFTDGEYFVLNIPVTDAVRSLGNITTFRIILNKFAKTSQSAASYIDYDYIYVGSRANAPGGEYETVSFYDGDELYDTKTVSYGKAYGSLPEISKPGYDFIGWYTQPNGGKLIKENSIVSSASDHSLYAQWQAKTYRVIFDNEFDFDEWVRIWKNTYPNVGNGGEDGIRRGTCELNMQNRSLTLTASSDDAYTITYGKQTDYYTMKLAGGQKYVLSFEVESKNTSNFKIIPYLFYYSENAATFDGGSSASQFEISPQKGIFTMEFSVPQGCEYVGVRFGLLSANTSVTISNIVVKRQEIFADGGYIPGVNLAGVEKYDFRGSYKTGYYATYTSGTDSYIEKDLTNTVQQKTYGSTYGEMPKPTVTGYNFLGWYTKPDGGVKVTENSVMNSAETQHLYSHWGSYVLKSDILTVDTDSKLIYGFPQGSTSLDSLVTLSDESCTLAYSTDIIGTGTSVNVMKDGEVYESYTAVLFGDTNSDGWYDGTDAVIVSCIAFGLLNQSNTSEAILMAADCNRDGAIGNLDIQLLKRAGVLLEKIDQTLPTEELTATSAYAEYSSLISQTAEISNESQNQPDETDDTPASTPIETNLFDLFVKAIELIIKKLFTLINLI